MKRLICVGAALTALVTMAEKRPFSDYQPIIDRQMFGALPPDFDPTKSPKDVAKSSSSSRGAGQQELTQEQAQLQSAVHFSVINTTAEGETTVGFTDNSDPKTPKHYYLKVGEEQDGWLVKEADPLEASMTIVKGEVEVTLKIGDNSAKSGGNAPKSSGGNSLRDRLQRVAPGLSSLRARQKQRDLMAKEEREKFEAEEKKRQAEQAARDEQAKAERDAERENMRQQFQAIQDQLRQTLEQQKKTQPAAEKNEDDDTQ